MSKCYDCGEECTKDFYYIDLGVDEDEPEAKIRVAIHERCHKRALNGGVPIYPERQTSPPNNHRKER